MSEMRKYSEEEILLSYKGRCISDREDMGLGYCGSCTIEIHRDQLNDSKSWVHSFVLDWIQETKPKLIIEQLQIEIIKTKIEQLEAELEELRWIPVDEEKPKYIKSYKISKDIEILDKGNVKIGQYLDGQYVWWNGSFRNTNSYDSQESITHWRYIVIPENEVTEMLIPELCTTCKERRQCGVGSLCTDCSSTESEVKE